MSEVDALLKDVVGRCTAVRTLSTGRAITRHYDNALRPVGLTITQFSLLVTIGRAKPDSITATGRWLGIDRTSLTRNLKPLEAAGYVVRGAEGAKRQRSISLTPAGRRILKKAYPLWQEAQSEAESQFTGNKHGEAMKALATLRGLSDNFVNSEFSF